MRYHALDDPEISDAEYDALFQALIALEKDHPDLVTPDSPSQRVGAPPTDGFEQVTHLRPMLSLDNAFSDEDVTAFHERTCERLNTSSVRYCVEPKIDGVAISLLYEAGKLVRAATRGDGSVGERMSRITLGQSNRFPSYYRAMDTPTCWRFEVKSIWRGLFFDP